MVSTHKKRQSNRRLVSQIIGFDQDVIIGNVASDERENAAVNESSIDRDFTVGTSRNNLVTNENTVNAKTLERCFKESIDSEMSKNDDKVEHKIQNAFDTYR